MIDQIENVNLVNIFLVFYEIYSELKIETTALIEVGTNDLRLVNHKL